MNLNYSSKAFNQLTHHEQSKRSAIHQAGHALAIYLNKKATKAISSEQTGAYEYVFEADVVSLLAGPLAEAKYVAMRDGELINPRLVNLNALHYYGGAYDLEIVNDYLACSILGKAEREKKIADLVFDAFDFINNGSNWLAITVLAYYILTDSSNIIECEEIMPHLMPSLVRS